MLLYHPKTGKAVKVPDIDASGWIAIHGYSTTPIEPSSSPVQLDLAPTPIALPPAQAMPSENGTVSEDGAAALAFINSADKAYKLLPLPTIGPAAARVIVEKRPEGGWKRLEDLAPILPAKASIEALKAWNPSDGE